MQDLKKLTLKALRDLAREKLGKGVASLRTKADLISALGAAVPGQVKRVVGRVGKAASAKKPKAPVRKKAAAPAAPPAAPPPPEPLAAAVQPAVAAPAARQVGEPDPEVFLVAKLVGGTAARAASAAEDRVPPAFVPDFDEDLGDLPESYGEDAVTLLPRDPHTLWLYWDFCRETLEEAFAWMPGASTRLRLYADDRLLREVGFSLDSRSWYFGELSPARAYRAELWALAIDGQARRIGPPSNEMRLPAEQPSQHVDDRFLRIPFDLPRAAAPAPQVIVPSEPFPPEVREALWEASGGALARTVGSSEQEAGGGGAEGPGGMLRGRGPWPWSGTFPRRS